MDLPVAMLNSIQPIAFITCSIGPVHFAVAISWIGLVVTLVDIAWSPSKFPISWFSITLIISLILIRISNSSLPQTFAVSQTIQEVAFEIAAIKPIVGSYPGRLSIYVAASIQIAIGKFL